jgi:trigger factor
MSTPIGDPRPAGEEGPAGDQRKAGEEGAAGDPRPAGEGTSTGSTPFDPSAHTVEEVRAHLDQATPSERDRVLQAERDGKARSSLID